MDKVGCAFAARLVLSVEACNTNRVIMQNEGEMQATWQDAVRFAGRSLQESLWPHKVLMT